MAGTYSFSWGYRYIYLPLSTIQQRQSPCQSLCFRRGNWKTSKRNFKKSSLVSLLNISKTLLWRYCRKKWELVKPTVGTNIGRSHLCLHFQAGNRLRQVVVWHFFLNFLTFSILKWNDSALLCFDTFSTLQLSGSALFRYAIIISAQ